MSERELNKGKLKPTGKTLEQYMDGVKIPDYYESKEEAFRDMYYRDAYLLNGFVYEIALSDYDDYDDIFESSENDDGTIDFLTKFHNGGCGFQEALDYATKHLQESKS